jgi:hypothetical protein
MLNEKREKMNESKKLYANMIGWSDVYPFEVIEKINEKTYLIRGMKAELIEPAKLLGIGGFCACFENSSQRWSITSDESKGTGKIRLHKDGRWYDKHHNRYAINDAPKYFYDYNF